MDNLLDFANKDETRPVEAAESTAAPETVETEATTQDPAETEAPTATESETPAPQVIEEIDTAPKAQVAKALPGKAVTKPVPYTREEPPPNPLILDPYEWDVR